MSFLTPLAFAAAALAVPIILLYMLRLRRREIDVSSTYLWQQLLLDREANTPWQRLRRNLLLLLQLLILALLIFALARPFIEVPAISTGQIALLIDASASMNATDGEDDATRFEQARASALEIVETMGARDTMTVIRVADVPEVLSPYTSNKSELRAAINSAGPTAASADWDAALTLAAAGSTGADDFSMVLISDGGLGGAELPNVEGEKDLITVGESNSNVGISALATSALPGQEPQLFAQMTNYGDQDTEVIFNLRVDGELFTAERYVVPAGADVPLVSGALPEDFVTLQAGITIPTDATVPDYLTTDNVAWAVAAAGDARRVLVMSPGNLFINRVLNILPSVDVFEGDIDQGLPTTEFDLYIFDSWLPDQLPDGDMLVINPPNSTPLWTVGLETTETSDPRVRRDDPRMAFVDFDTVNLRIFREVSADWAEPLITVEGGPLLLAGEVGGRQVAILPFDLFETDLPLQITWPILVSRLLDWYQPQDIIDPLPGGLRVGESLLIRPPLTAESVRVVLPDETTRDLPAGREQVVFAETREPGVYIIEVIENDNVTQTVPFAVNLFDENESDIAPQATVIIGEETIAEAQEEELGQREFWPWLALAALAVLLLEWYAYHRRLRAPRVLSRPVTPRRSTS